MHNITMNIYDLMKEYTIELNDVRWFLAKNLAYTLTELSRNQDYLTDYIASGELDEELYNMEENYIDELQNLMERNQIDIVNIRETFNSILILKEKRKR